MTCIESVEKKMSINLGLDQDQINEKHHIVMFDIFVCKSFAVGALSQSNTFTKTSIISPTVDCVEMW